MANTLIALPPEIVHLILKYVDPKDLARVARTCWVLQRSVVRDRLLWREVGGERWIPMREMTKGNARSAGLQLTPLIAEGEP